MSKKLSVLLGLRDKIEKTFSNMLDDMAGKFKNKQGLFLGYRKTYQALEGYADDPAKRGFQNVASTVGEQLHWFKEHTRDYFETIFSIERTNAVGDAKAELVVFGETWGIYTTLELLRLKSVLDGKIKSMINDIPVRSESHIWELSQDDVFQGREVVETPKDSGFSRTTLKESYILTDPHPDKSRQPVVASKDTIVNIGKYTTQDYSGAYTMRQRAELLVKYDLLYKAVVEALGNANNVETVESNLGTKVLEYLF